MSHFKNHAHTFVFLIKCVCAGYTLGCSGWAYFLSLQTDAQNDSTKTASPKLRLFSFYPRTYPPNSGGCKCRKPVWCQEQLEWPSVFPSVGILTPWLRLMKSCFEHQDFLLSRSEMCYECVHLDEQVTQFNRCLKRKVSKSHSLLASAIFAAPALLRQTK